jgi:hypothetical protein
MMISLVRQAFSFWACFREINRGSWSLPGISPSSTRSLPERQAQRARRAVIDADATVPARLYLQRLIEADDDLGPRAPIADAEHVLSSDLGTSPGTLEAQDALR